MKAKWIIGLLLCSLAVSSAAAMLTPAENGMVAGIDSSIERGFLSKTRFAAINGQKSVVPSLQIKIVEQKGDSFEPIDAADFPPVLSNLKVDLKNTDILDELKSKGLKIEGKSSDAPRLQIEVIGTPAINSEFKLRKMYLVRAYISQVILPNTNAVAAAYALGSKKTILAGKLERPAIVSTDDTTDAAKIRVAVRQLVDEYISETKGVDGTVNPDSGDPE
jgi:hypothetical protein